MRDYKVESVGRGGAFATAGGEGGGCGLDEGIVGGFKEDVDGSEVCRRGREEFIGEGGDHAGGCVDGYEGADVGREGEGEEAGAAADFEDVQRWVGLVAGVLQRAQWGQYIPTFGLSLSERWYGAYDGL